MRHLAVHAVDVDYRSATASPVRVRQVDDGRAHAGRTKDPSESVGGDARSLEVASEREHANVVGEIGNEEGAWRRRFRNRASRFVANRRRRALCFATIRARSRRFVAYSIRLRFPAPPP
jgi:hypothetical protein